ncbi:hypothetical protein BKA67DRAFT_588206 [Truncatella angustata]|uniref:Uncharacterized protein n=1 Tax=Truncatella angustata TaxID=152316 RepID=A0A9P8REU7_9PEZI|nr:uncharacterized protein BKA67DRAFT_588206 [Truncatella angustata]KAH6639989.1 hypothetical protein BKA67DRAFT_588206 [Truncatella angustata]
MQRTWIIVLLKISAQTLSTFRLTVAMSLKDINVSYAEIFSRPHWVLSIQPISGIAGLAGYFGALMELGRRDALTVGLIPLF